MTAPKCARPWRALLRGTVMDWIRNVMTENRKLRELPSVGELLAHPAMPALAEQYGRQVTTHAIRVAIDGARTLVLDGKQIPQCDELVSDAAREARRISEPSLCPVVNATGIILHTNLGRAPLGRAVIDEIAKTCCGYSNLEFDLRNAGRGDRNVHVRSILTFLSGAEDAVVVNNNAAGVLLVLNALGCGREVIVSRGELIEIGGSFRIPEIMAASGARMVEVGTTNRTRASDYERAIGQDTALIFKAHKSNYSIQGFTEEVSTKDLAQLAHTHKLPILYDIGSGLLSRPAGLPLDDEPDVAGAIVDGADLVAFSCDKLLGGPQAGVVAGRKEWISRIAKTPMMRALRVDKLTIAALTAACKAYLREGDLGAANVTYGLLERSEADLKQLAAQLLAEVSRLGISAQIVESWGQCGGGTLPDLRLKSLAVEILPFDETDPKSGRRGKTRDRKSTSVERLHSRLLISEYPILAVLREGKLLFDVLTIFEADIPQIARTILEGIRAEREQEAPAEEELQDS